MSLNLANFSFLRFSRCILMTLCLFLVDPFVLLAFSATNSSYLVISVFFLIFKNFIGSYFLGLCHHNIMLGFDYA